jgi:hypothetical protein
MKKIMLDPGHGGRDTGAVASGLVEKFLNLEVAKKVRSCLLGYDAQVRLTRELDEALSADERVAVVAAFNPDLCVSIHHNAANGIASGSEIIHGARNKRDDRLAELIQENLQKAGMPARRIFSRLNDQGQDWYFMIRRIADGDTETIIVEGGFVDHPQDARLLKDASFLEAEARAIAEGIISYLKLQRLTAITGQAAAAKAQMAACALRKNPSPKLPYCSLEELAHLYIVEGALENIRGDIAWAQALKETGAFRYGGIVLPEQNNFAGIGAVNGGRQGQAAAFETPLKGVRAQLQHLKAYASKAALANPCVDPRFGLVKRGSAPYVEWLGAANNPEGVGWAYPGESYGQDIVKILNEILSVE